MKNILLGTILMLFSWGLRGQIGVSGGYLSFDADEWIEGINMTTGDKFSNPSGYQVSVDYWFRLKSRRIEFLPAINYSALDQTSNASQMDNQLIGFHLNTHVYLFDLEGDCDCPTWSKSGGIFEKGFFLLVSPGVTHFNIKVGDEVIINGESVTFFDVGIGAGLDIGISEFLTLTPIFRYHFSPQTEWELQEETTVSGFPVLKAAPKQFFAGLRLGINLN